MGIRKKMFKIITLNLRNKRVEAEVEIEIEKEKNMKEKILKNFLKVSNLLFKNWTQIN